MNISKESGSFYISLAEGERIRAPHFKITPTKGRDVKVEMTFYLKDFELDGVQGLDGYDTWETGDVWGDSDD